MYVQYSLSLSLVSLQRISLTYTRTPMQSEVITPQKGINVRRLHAKVLDVPFR